MRTKFLYFLMLSVLSLASSSCDLEKDVEVELPYHEPKLVVECYLEPGKTIRALVLESAGYFDDAQLPLVPDAEVTIGHNGRTLQLSYKPFQDRNTGRFYTHTSSTNMKGKPGDIYSIEVVDGKGRRVTGYTVVQKKVPIDTVEWKFNEDKKAYLLTTFKDDGNTKDFYRYMTHRDSLMNGSQRDIVTSDRLNNGKIISFGSAYDYEEGDTLIVSLYHIEEQYYDFLSSTSDAKDANGNPFAQPTKIKSSVQGGYGIFTNLAYERKKVIITR
ncbi:DUF4249 domain-containing protein [Pontibacter rugosus]|uniref:DUF4249 domain-containing protein n=1 Tax=Pontibacter rugosus TaxID=1745966 RepID=A0ABW3SQR0_9BACT